MIDLFEDVPKTDRMTLEDVKIGVPIFLVHALGERSYLTKVTPTSAPYVSEHSGSRFIDYTYESKYDDGGVHMGRGSLRDMGIIPNNYNDHRAFLDEQTAKDYLAIVKTQSGKLKISYLTRDSITA